MKKEKAIKHLKNCKGHRDFWREQYVSILKDKNELLDIPLSFYDSKTLRQVKINECIEEIKEINKRISKFERLVF